MTRPSARRRNNADVMKLYRRCLAEEEAREMPPRKGASGRPKEAARRAMERTAEKLDYGTWQSVETAVKRWAAANGADIETYGMVLDDNFSMEVRLIQDAVGKMLTACDDLIAGAGSLEMDHTVDVLKEVAETLDLEMPTHLCPLCKAVVPGCKECDGSGWWAGVDVYVDPKLLDAEDICVVVDGKVVALEEM